jgi:hypothetical protein
MLLGKGEKARHSSGDMRSPAPGDEWTPPLCLIYENSAFEAREWLQELEVTAAEAQSMLPPDEVPTITNMDALNYKKLHPISGGHRGKLWTSDELHE